MLLGVKIIMAFNNSNKDICLMCKNCGKEVFVKQNSFNAVLEAKRRICPICNNALIVKQKRPSYNSVIDNQKSKTIEDIKDKLIITVGIIAFVVVTVPPMIFWFFIVPIVLL